MVKFVFKINYFSDVWKTVEKGDQYKVMEGWYSVEDRWGFQEVWCYYEWRSEGRMI